MLDKIDRKLLALLQQDCTLSLQALAEAVNLTTTPCWKRLKRLEDDGILLGKVALLDPEKIGLGLTAFVLIKTQHHSSEWYCRFVTVVTAIPFAAVMLRMELPLRHGCNGNAGSAWVLAHGGRIRLSDARPGRGHETLRRVL